MKSFLNFIDGSNDEDVIILTAENFEKTVMQSNDIWFVDFYGKFYKKNNIINFDIYVYNNSFMVLSL